MHHNGQNVTNNALTTMEGIIYQEFHKKVALVMQDQRTSVQSIKEKMDTIIIDQWVMTHLDHPGNREYLRADKGVCR